MNLLSVKIDLNFKPDYDWGEDGSQTLIKGGVLIEDVIYDELTEIGMNECMFHSSSWGVFVIDIDTYAELPETLTELDEKIKEIGIKYGIML